MKEKTSSAKILQSLKQSHFKSRLAKQKSISIISLNMKSFEQIKRTYGERDFNKIYNLIKESLLSSWGAKNFFRKDDLLVKDSQEKTLFYILLSPSRLETPVLEPGKLKEIAKRIEENLEKTLWENFQNKSDRLFPSYIESIPKIHVGYATALSFPGKDLPTLIRDILEEAKAKGDVRAKARNSEEKEILHYLIANEGILFPSFQGIFRVSDIKKIGATLKQNRQALEALEALIRVDQKRLNQELKKKVKGFLNLSYISPEPLFQIAKERNLELELDYKCIQEAIKVGRKLKKKLFINILPRNIYLIEAILKDIPRNLEVAFEVSETEAIRNISLIQSLRKKITNHSLSLVIDDFGQGHSNFYRILQLKPELIKIDRALIQDIQQSKLKQKFITSLVEGLKGHTTILAEGVETEDEFEMIKKLGIPLVQGYLFHRPEAFSKNLL